MVKNTSKLDAFYEISVHYYLSGVPYFIFHPLPRLKPWAIEKFDNDGSLK